MATASMAPEQPRRWPIAPLLAVTGSERGVAERPRRGRSPREVVEGGAGAVGVDEGIRLRVDARVGERRADGGGRAGALGVGSGHVVGVARGAPTEQLGQGSGAAAARVLQGLEDEHAGALADRQTGAVGAERPARPLVHGT